MLSTTDCINRIQGLLDGGGDVAREQVAELVWAYAAYCRQVSEKARACLDLLRQGRRAEARRLAKEPPDLEKELDLLDFLEREEWLDLCDGAGLPIRQGLDMLAARSIVQEVYGDDGQMEQVLRKFRRMSLGQAPLADRLRALRAIRQADPDHDFWEDDIRTYEAARLEELVAEVKDADTRGDLLTIEHILGELQSGAWLTKAAAHVSAIDKIAGPHRRRYAAGRFRELLGSLHEAQGEMDAERCRSLMAEWQGVIGETGVAPDQEMQDGVAPVEAWLNDLDAAARENAAYQKACAQLEKAIDDGEQQQPLEQLAAEVFRFERGMPELLAAKFNTRMEDLKGRSRRRFALALTGIVGGLLLVAGGVTFLVLWQLHESELEGWQGRIAGALEKGDLESAHKMLENVRQNSPDLCTAPEIVDLQLEYGKKVHAERTRVEEFKKIRQRIEGQGPGDPDRPALARAGALATDLQEKHWVQEWELKYNEAAEAAQRQCDKAFERELDRLKELHAAFSQAERAGRLDLGQYINPVLELANEMMAVSDVSEGLVAQVKPILNHALRASQEFQASASRRKAVQEVLAGLPGLATDPARLEETLTGFVKQYGDQQLAAGFAKAAAMAPHWRAADDWCQLVKEWKGQLRITAPSEAVSRSERVKAFAEKHPNGPYATAVQDYLAYLQVARTAFPGDRLVGATKVQEILSGPIFTPALRMFRTEDGKTFYALEKHIRPQLGNDRVLGYTFRYLKSMNMIYENASLAKDAIAVGPVPAPQRAFSEAASERLAGFPGSGWETLYLELAALATAQKDVDPILTGQILQLLLGFAASTSPYEADWVKRYEERISTENLDFVAWLDPYQDSDPARNRVRQLLDSMEPFPEVVDGVKKKLAAMEQSLKPCQPAGVLLGESERVRFAEPPADGTLLVIWGKPGQEPAFEEIGKVEKGQTVVRDGMTAPFPDGTPVFLRAKAAQETDKAE